MQTLFSQDTSNALVLGLGGLGCLAARAGNENGDDSAAVWSAAHFNSAELIATGLERKLFLKCEPGMSVEDAMEDAVGEHTLSLEKYARGRDVVILCAELGDAWAVQAARALNTALATLDIRVAVLLLEPFNINASISAAEIQRARDAWSGIRAFVCSINAGLDDISAGIALKRIRNMAAQRLAAAAECLAAAFSSGSACARELLEKRGLHRAIYVTAERSETDLDASTGAACTRALRLIDDDSEDLIETAIVARDAELSVREASTIHRLLPARTRVISATNATLEGRVECLLVCGQRRASNVVELKEARKFLPRLASIDD